METPSFKKNKYLCSLLGQSDSTKGNLRKVCVTLHIKIKHLDTTYVVVLMQFEKHSAFLIKEKTLMSNNQTTVSLVHADCGTSIQFHKLHSAQRKKKHISAK